MNSFLYLSTTQTSFWESSLTGAIIGFLGSILVFFLGNWINEKNKKSAIRREAIQQFLNSHSDLLKCISDSKSDKMDYTEIRKACSQIHNVYLLNIRLKTKLDELIKIHSKDSNEYRELQPSIKGILLQIDVILREECEEFF